MKILLTGCRGQIGTAITHHIVTSGLGSKIELVASGRDQLDITDRKQVELRINCLRPDVVINCAAYTKVDEAEQNPETAFAVNGDGPASLARACARYSAKLIHISTDFVFDGSQTSAYREDDAVNPLNVYGRSKAAGESSVRELCDNYVILRTAWAYSSWGDNFMKAIANRILQGQPLRVVNDQFGSPTAATDIAEAILEISVALYKGANAQKLNGTYHYTGQGIASWYNFAKKIGERIEFLTGIKAEIEPVPTSGYPTLAHRPPYSALNCERVKQRFDVAPAVWQLAVDREVDFYVKDSFAEKLATVA